MSEETRSTVIVNLYAGPGAGKTTCAWIIAAELKKRGVVAEYVPEYAKELVWDKRFDLLDGSYANQLTLFAEQNRRLERLVGQVDVVVTDSPLLLGVMYTEERRDEVAAKVLEQYHKYRNFNLFISRGTSFENAGRIHDLADSKRIDSEIRQFLEQNNIYYGTYKHGTVPIIVDNIQKHLEKSRSPPSQAKAAALPRLTDEQIQRAREVDLLTYFQTRDPHAIRKVGLNEYCLKAHDSFKISNGKWHWHSRGFGGHGALSYLIKVEGMDFVSAVEHLTGRSIPTPQRSSPPTPRAPPKPFKLPAPNRNADRAYAYLRGRGIGKELINRCIKEGLLYESAHTRRCVFVGKDGAVPKFACERGTVDDWKKDVVGSDKRFSFHLPPVTSGCTELAVFEGAIDVLAHHEVCRLKQSSRDGYRLSLGGTSSLALMSFLERHPQITTLYLCLDNDEPGRLATTRITEELSRDERFSHLRVAAAPATVGKDYGDMLETMHQVNIQSNRRQAEFLR